MKKELLSSSSCNLLHIVAFYVSYFSLEEHLFVRLTFTFKAHFENRKVRICTKLQNTGRNI
jgi:hypothetical protein